MGECKKKALRSQNGAGGVYIVDDEGVANAGGVAAWRRRHDGGAGVVLEDESAADVLELAVSIEVPDARDDVGRAVSVVHDPHISDRHSIEPRADLLHKRGQAWIQG